MRIASRDIVASDVVLKSKNDGCIYIQIKKVKEYKYGVGGRRSLSGLSVRGKIGRKENN